MRSTLLRLRIFSALHHSFSSHSYPLPVPPSCSSAHARGISSPLLPGFQGLTNSASYSMAQNSHPRPGFKQMLLHASLRWQMRFSNVSIAFFHDACEALSEAGRKLCLYSENDIARFASILKREEIVLPS